MTPRQVEDRPDWIPNHASHVTSFGSGGRLWLWEFAGGATASLAWSGPDGQQLEQINIPFPVWRDVVSFIVAASGRYDRAFGEELARQESYERYLASVDYEEDRDWDEE